MSDSDDDDLFCAPRAAKPRPPPKKKAKAAGMSILDQVMAADAKTEARVTQLQALNAASRADLEESTGAAPSTAAPVQIDWDYIRRKPGSSAAKAAAALRAVDARPGGDAGVEVMLGCSTRRRVRAPDAAAAETLLDGARTAVAKEKGELARAFAALIADDSTKKTPAARNALLEALGGRYAALYALAKPCVVPPALSRWLQLTCALDARPAVARGALETLIALPQSRPPDALPRPWLDEGVIDAVLALYVADADVAPDEDACRRLDRALAAWAAGVERRLLDHEALQRLAATCISLAHDGNVATAPGGGAAARDCARACLRAMADAGGDIYIVAGDPRASRDAARRCVSVLRALPPPTTDGWRAATERCCRAVFRAALADASADDVEAIDACAHALRAVSRDDPPLGAHATLYALLCAVAALHACCGGAASDAHDALATEAEQLRKRVASLDATAARNAEFLDTLIATCHQDRDARARKGLVQRTIAAAGAPAAPDP